MTCFAPGVHEGYSTAPAAINGVSNEQFIITGGIVWCRYMCVARRNVVSSSVRLVRSQCGSPLARSVRLPACLPVTVHCSLSSVGTPCDHHGKQGREWQTQISDESLCVLSHWQHSKEQDQENWQ